ncbi:1,3-beta-glucanosyltransferase [Dionaea muscipula]
MSASPNGKDGNSGMNWLMLELLCRDFFRFITKKYSSGTRRLHESQPDVYEDNNHKPAEMALAITEYEALCGFDSIEVNYQLFSHFIDLVSLRHLMI